MTKTPNHIFPSVMIVAITEHAASQVPASTLGWDRQPLKPADRRLYGLRDVVGYRGWIDQAGYPVVGS